MKDLINRTIEQLKKKVKSNLDKINQNQAKISDMLNQPFSTERTYHIEKIYTQNKSLLGENNDFINLQLSLLNFLEKYKNAPAIVEEEVQDEIDAYAVLDESELFDLTIQGKLNFELGHPKFDDESFFNKLLSYYATIEAYEKCKVLLEMRKKNQIS